MVTAQHQWLLLWIARKMTADGYFVVGYDGPTIQAGIWNSLPKTCALAGVRPDAWAVDPVTSAIAVGEAKTATDVDTEHTRKQLRVFGYLRNKTSKEYCKLYLAVPRSAARALEKVLGDLRLLRARNVVRIHVPDCLLGGA